jgi:hypothetical protein
LKVAVSVFFSQHAAGDHRVDLGVLGLDRRLAALEQGIFQ